MQFDEAVASGQLRLELRGNPDTARAHVLAGRKLLGQLRSIYGVNARIAAGQPGGYYYKLATLADGSTIEAISNNGADTLRITTARLLTSSERTATLHGADSAGALDPHQAGYTPSRVEQPLPGDPPVAREEPELVEEHPTADFIPYLWAGVRFIDPLRVIVEGGGDEEGAPEQLTAEDGITLHLCLWLPPERDGEDPLILSNRRHLLGNRDVADLAAYPLQNPANSLVNEDEDPTYGAAYTGKPAFEPVETLRAVQFSRAYQQLVDGADLYAPDDILREQEWQEVVIVDPDDDLGLGLDSGPPGGTYYIKVMPYYGDCAPLDPFEVELRVIVGKGEHAIDSSFTFTLTESTAYLMAALPLGWHSTAFDAQFGRETHDPPLGRRLCSENILDDGDNPHGPHWWQGGVEILMPERQDAVPAKELQEPQIWVYDEGDPDADVRASLVPDYGFVPANFPDKQALCAYCTVRTYTVAFLLSYLSYPYFKEAAFAGPPNLYGVIWDIWVEPFQYIFYTSTAHGIDTHGSEAGADAELAAKGLDKNAVFYPTGVDLPPITRNPVNWYGPLFYDNNQAYFPLPFVGPFPYPGGAGGDVVIHDIPMPGSATAYVATAEQTTNYDAAGNASATPWAWRP